MKDSKYFNLRELTLDLNEILNKVEYLREENASLKNQEFIGETIKQLIRR